jgi:hypothetical protein
MFIFGDLENALILNDFSPRAVSSLRPELPVLSASEFSLNAARHSAFVAGCCVPIAATRARFGNQFRRSGIQGLNRLVLSARSYSLVLFVATIPAWGVKLRQPPR